MANPNNNPVSGGYYGPDPSPGTGASQSGSTSSSSSAAQQQGGGPVAGTIYDEFPVTCSIAINTPTRVQDFRVPPGYHVEVWPEPGNNAAGFKVARIASATINGPFSTFFPSSSGRAFPGIRNTSELWMNFPALTDRAIIRIVR